MTTLVCMADEEDGAAPAERFPRMHVGYGGRVRGRTETGEEFEIDLGWTTKEVRIDDPELRRVMPDGSTVPAHLQQPSGPPRPPDFAYAEFENVAIKAKRLVKTADGSRPSPGALVMLQDLGPWLEPEERALIVQLLDASIRGGGETSRGAEALRRKLSAD